MIELTGSLEPRRLYVLSDGSEEYKMRWMTSAELEQAQIEANVQTDGNFSWYLVEDDAPFLGLGGWA